MKTNSKRGFAIVLGLSILTASTPFSVFADEVNGGAWRSMRDRTDSGAEDRDARMMDRRGNMEERKSDRQEASCERILSVSEDHSKRFSAKKDEFGQMFSDNAGAFEDRRDTRDANLNGIREKQDEARNEMYMRLEEKAKTDEEKKAVKDFRETLEEAVTDRRKAFDNAVDTFRSGVDGLVASKKTSVTGSVDDFQASVAAAFDKAKSDCSAGADPKTVRETLMTTLKNNREKLRGSAQSFEKIGDSVASLAKTRDAAFKKAADDFKSTVEKARTDLKQVMQG